MLDWSDVVVKKKPTRKQRGLYHNWIKYLRDSRLTEDEIQRRAMHYAERNEKVPKD